MNEAVTNKLEFDKEQKDKLRLQAQMNDFMYKLLREESYNAQLDEVIGAEFIDYRQSFIRESSTFAST